MLFTLLTGIALWSQITISGKVTYKNKVLKDISVTLKDTYDGATTDANGNYSFTTTETGDKTLLFSGKDYDEVEIPVKIEGKDIAMNANLKQQINEINAVVIIVAQNGDNFVRHQGKLKDYSGLNFSINYVPSVGKKDSKSFTVFVLSINNILGNKNVYGFNYSADGASRTAVRPPVNTFVFVGVFVSFGVDKTNDAINNNL